MNQKEFNEVIVRQTDHCKSMLVVKGAEYAPRAVKNTAVDRLAAFQEGSSGDEYHTKSGTYGDAVQAPYLCIGYVYG